MSSKKYGAQFLKGLKAFRVAEEVNSEVIESFLSALDCPRALTVALLFRNEEHEQLSQLTFNPLHYDTMVKCRDAYAATKFLSKYKDLSLESDLDEVAFAKFDEFESLCKRTNSRFKDLASDPLFTGRTVWLHNAVIRKIDQILGEFDADEFFSMPDWGPGATTLMKRRDASPAKKFQREVGITRDLYDLIPSSLLRVAYPLWEKQLSLSGFPAFQVGNKVITVPKDASTNRVIAVEPGINLWFQMSIGRMIGRRLLRRGVDLRYQSRNQGLALKGSLTNLLATVDLSSASDSISTSVVEALFPPRWYHLMDACRSHYGSRGAHPVKWEKFSSMGNGFTFQLESLIFYAVACCCAEYLHVGTSDVSSYGDDVILPSNCFELFSRMMEFYGFRINVKKSHVDSPFRESCGAHYFLGIDVKPIYLKGKVKSVPSVYRLANAIRRLSHRRNLGYGCDERLRPAFELLTHSIPKGLRLWIPEGYGDGGFIGSFDEAAPSRARHGIEGYHFRHVAEVSKTHQDETEGYLLASLWSLVDEDTDEYLYSSRLGTFMLLYNKSYGVERHANLKANVTLGKPDKRGGRNSVPLSGQTKLRMTYGLARQWYDLGPWF